jgi:ribosomal protein S2
MKRMACGLITLALCLGPGGSTEAAMTGPAKEITKAQAKRMAEQYVKVRKLPWGRPTNVTPVEQGSAVLVEGPDGQRREESWEKVYYVQYPTSKQERELKGIRTVIVTRDGTKIGIPMGE